VGGGCGVMRFEGVAADGCMSWQADALLSVSLAKARVVHGVQRVVVDLNLPMSSITGKKTENILFSTTLGQEVVV